jgi:alpha-tubulin suppressor-like RCC1 family protein
MVSQPPATAQSGVALSPAPVIGLLDRAGNRLTTRGVAITAGIASGTGSVAGLAEVRTDAAGEARFDDLRVVGPVGTVTLRFTAAGLTPAGSSPIAVAAGPPSAIAPEAGNNQTAAAGTAVPVAPAVRITDGSANPVPNVQVTFTVSGGEGTVEGSPATTGADGVARITKWTLGTAVGPNSVTAAAGSLQQAFQATGTVGPPARIVIVEGDGQSAVIGQAVAVAPAVRVTDAFDNPVSGVAVTFAAGSNGTATGAQPQTDPAGLARVTAWILGLAPGGQSLTATRTGATTATFAATATHFPTLVIASGALSTCAVAVGGTAYCWGDNSVGQLGDSTLVGKSTPTALKFGGGSFTMIAVGGGHACGLVSGGAAFCWGLNASGQLGDNSNISRLVPVPVVGGHLFQAIVTGDTHSCGLRLDGTAWCWGSNANGRLGDSTLTARDTPVAVKGGLVFTALSAGSSHTCGITATGVYCWGANGSGRLGDGTTIDRRAPTAPLAPGITFTAVAAGGIHTCALATGGAAMCWGAGSSGVLGTGTTAGQPTPTAVSGTATYTQIATGANHSCAITAGNAVHCWGANGSGRLGDGTTTSRLVPTPVAATFSAVALSLGDEHTCARSQAGSSICWGRNLEGQVGDGGLLSALRPTGVKSP